MILLRCGEVGLCKPRNKEAGNKRVTHGVCLMFGTRCTPSALHGWRTIYDAGRVECHFRFFCWMLRKKTDEMPRECWVLTCGKCHRFPQS